ncbi:MAG: single-stranded DNA-binding protein [Coriobacteriales bacterium]|jgi:single-strand DNA-binding protein|nr:single-stranded DNA-binding protein [Coriobacteriales bacterium]
MSINKVIITGNLTRDPELTATPSGMPVLSLGVAVNDRRKNSSTGEWEDIANYIDCTMFGTRAESVARFLSKGSKVGIDGKLRWHQWETRDGQKRSKVDVIIDDIEFLSPRNAGTGATGAQSSAMPAAKSSHASYSAPEADAPIPAAPEITVYDDDIPF